MPQTDTTHLAKAATRSAAPAAKRSAWRRALATSLVAHVGLVLVAASIAFSAHPIRPEVEGLTAEFPADRITDPLPVIETHTLDGPKPLPRGDNPDAGGRGDWALLNSEATITSRLQIGSPAADRSTVSAKRDDQSWAAGLADIVGPVVDGPLGGRGSPTAGHGAGTGVGDGSQGGFFGIRTNGRRVVYIVDGSASMNRPVEGPAKTRFNQLKLELMRSILELEENQQFYIIFFNEHPIPMPSSGMEIATQSNRERLLRWMAQVHAEGLTDPTPAIAAALSLNPDVIYFLTDGTFETSVEHDLKRFRGGDIIVNTIAFGDRSAEPFLRAMATRNHGQFSFVP